jgi:hypothetical protein
MIRELDEAARALVAPRVVLFHWPQPLAPITPIRCAA